MAKPNSEQVKALLDPALDAKAEEAAGRMFREDSAGKLAAATPLPGPLADVFAPRQDIQVGPYSVRPVYDVDLEVLCALKHPFGEFVTQVIAGNNPPEFIPRGQDAWTLFWMFTHTPDEVDVIVAGKDGLENLRKLARQQFRNCSVAALFKLYEAVVSQLGVLNSVGVAHGAPVQEGEQGGNPPSSVVPLTGTGG